MEVTKGLVAQKHSFSKCVICAHKFAVDDLNPCSDEHIIPEFLGGKFKIGILCKTCNNRLGGGFEDRLAQSFLGKLHAYKYQVKGKSKRVPSHPLVGNYFYKKNFVFLNSDFKVQNHYSFKEVEDNNKVYFSVFGDATDLNKLKDDTIVWRIQT